MALKPTVFQRLKDRFARYTPSNLSVLDTSARDTLLDANATGVGVVGDQLTLFNNSHRFLATAIGMLDAGSNVLELYAADRDTARGYKQNDTALRVILCDWWDYAARRGTYRGNLAEALWRLSTMPVMRTPLMALCKTTGVTTPLGLRTSAIKALGVRYVYYAPAAVSTASLAPLWAALTPLRMHYSVYRLDPAVLRGGLPEVVIHGEQGTFTGTATAMTAAGGALVPSDNAASYMSPETVLTVDIADIDEYSWYIDWRDYERVGLARVTARLRWWDVVAGSWTAWTEVTRGQQVTPNKDATKVQFDITFAADETTETIGTPTATATALTGTLTLPRLPTSVVITDGTAEQFTDLLGTGVLTGSLGGSGTINYVTGAVELAFGGTGASGAAVVAHYWPTYLFDTWTLKSVHWQVH